MKLNIKARHFVPGAARHVLYNLRSFAISVTHAAPESPKTHIARESPETYIARESSKNEQEIKRESRDLSEAWLGTTF